MQNTSQITSVTADLDDETKSHITNVIFDILRARDQSNSRNRQQAKVAALIAASMSEEVSIAG